MRNLIHVAKLVVALCQTAFRRDDARRLTDRIGRGQIAPGHDITDRMQLLPNGRDIRGLRCVPELLTLLFKHLLVNLALARPALRRGQRDRVAY